MIAAVVFAVGLQALQTATQPPGTLRGRVTNAEGRPLSRAGVLVQRIGERYEPRGVRADETGLFEITNIPAGEYMLFVSRSGYQTTRFPERTGQTFPSILLAPGETTKRINVVLRRLGAIEGRIVDQNGDPVEGALVSALFIPPHVLRNQRAATSAPMSPPRRTNDLGQFRIYGLSGGDFYVVAGAQSVNGLAQPLLPGHSTTFFPGVSNPADAQVVHVAPSETVNGVDFVLARGRMATVSGQMLSAAGESFQGAIQLHLRRRSGVDLGSVGAFTYPDGRFEFRNVSPGEYVIETRRNDERGYQSVTVNGADVSGLIVQTQSGSTVAGRLVFEGNAPPDGRRAGEFVAYSLDPDVSTGGAPRTGVRPDSTFELTKLFGSRLLRFSGPPTGWTVKQILAGGADVTDTFLPFGSAGQSLKDVEVVLTDQLTKISGTVLNRLGNPQTAGPVIVFSDDPNKWTPLTRFVTNATPDKDGSFSITGLPPGSYFVAGVDTFPGGGIAEAVRDPEFLEPLSRSAKHVILTEGHAVAVTLRVIEQ